MLQEAIRNVFLQLSVSLDQLDPGQYAQACRSLNNSSIGKHVRHVIELFQCLEKGYASGIVNYENRKRDEQIENDKEFACSLLQEIQMTLDKPDRDLVLQSSSGMETPGYIAIRTNYTREILYNLEHTIHHMAMVRIGVTEVSEIELPENYGVASSTIKFRDSCAQ